MDHDEVELYIEQQPEKQQQYLRQVRDIVMDVVPDATQVISYQIPAFRLHSKMLVYMAGWQTYISMYPIPPLTDQLAQQVAPYVAGKGTLRFMLDAPLPVDLIRDIVEAHKQRVNSA